VFVLLEIFCFAGLALLASRLAPGAWRGRLLNAIKLAVTFEAFRILLMHPVRLEDGSSEVAWRLVLETLRGIDAGTFWTFCALAAGVKFVGILASMYRWTVLLRGQAIELPFRHIFGSFLIGRFIGTFLPSTAGLDGYKLYDAARFSGRTVEVTATTVLEKVIGVSGIFLSFLVALPFGIKIFGERAGTIALLTVPVCAGIIAALLLVLWYPSLVQWLLLHLPIPGKARLEGLVLRIARSAAAYRDKRGIVVQAFALSFVVHFSTAAMYYFTALAIGARNAEFWPIAFGSSIQILATVLSPFTIAGEGIREAAQYVLLGHMIGPADAIVSAALGFWAAEALTLVGGIVWWVRPAGYRPEFCLVNGEQVDYEAAARAALQIESEEERRRRVAAPPAPLGVRARLCAGLGLGAGVLGGLVIGAAEAGVIAAGGLGPEAQVLWYGPLAYAVVLGLAGAAGGLVLALLPLDELEIRGWMPSLALLGTALPMALAITLFRLRRDVYLEQTPPLPVLAAVMGAAAAVALVLLLLGPRLFRSRAGALARPLPALALLATLAVGAAFAARSVALGAPAPPSARAVPPALAQRPNVILVMVDTLRADHLSCYGSELRTPSLCSLANDGGTRFKAFSHASWTRPSAATLLTSLLPASHGVMSKPSSLAPEALLLPELLQEAGYTTGGIAANINLAPSFGFDQGYDEYHYLAPDYLAGAQESSSKLILYQIGRAVWFKIKPGLRFGDFYQDSAVVNEVAFDFLERNRDSRFFLFLHYMDPHDPYFRHPYDGHGIARVANQHPTPALVSEMQQLYRGEIEYLDANFAKLLAKLRELGLYDRTLIVLTSDHGEEFQEHGGFWHGLTLYDEQVHVPLLVKWAGDGARPQGDPANHQVGLLDVAPTILARAGARIPPTLQGVDLALSVEERPEKSRIVFAEEDHEGNVLRAVRTEEWKLIEANPGNPRGLAPLELFQVSEGPGEKHDLSAQRSDRIADLRHHADMQQRLAQSQSVGGGATAELSAAEQEALRMLGYVEEEPKPKPPEGTP
jgi:arylsulfatase A-like enzyme/uncharacterized membrane protein YbhN (UPF0104 family)